MRSGHSRTVAVLGPGGVGGLVGALAARAGHRVVFLAGAETVEVLRRDGVSVESKQFGTFQVRVEADTELREPADVCLVTVKQTSLAQALERVPPAVLGDGLVVPLLNGIDHVAALRDRYRPDQVVPAVVRVESTRVAPGRITQGSSFVDIDLASATADRERLDALARVLVDSGVRATVKDDENAVLWGKLSFLAPFALLTTRYGLTIGEVRTERRAELLALVEETAALSRACGGPGDPAASLALYDAFPPEAKSSMQRDAEAGRPLELDAIGGALLRAAQRHGVPVPLTDRLMDELSAVAG
ncbi:ketopantoate reductase family protein [Streptacidiphilus jiangxiensis]|uniref:2-dehydropantoate 2-reductase n=1 Tax=Streptacidiphilus jiangxiensis TaxID=235985 RepID=A0A1H7VM89_STRJI|nr:2-dehydropantoate 2-reductase [Streptacidiphilus jiangxiensis]SEM09898.1 2-dehydropantoate 2-reductase [Streptacidiphilus jiangxiensis]